MTGVTDTLKQNIGYDPEADGSVELLIAYKDALEEVVDSIDIAATVNARGRSSAADVCAALFADGFGNLTREELRGRDDAPAARSGTISLGELWTCIRPRSGASFASESSRAMTTHARPAGSPAGPVTRGCMSTT